MAAAWENHLLKRGCRSLHTGLPNADIRACLRRPARPRRRCEGARALCRQRRLQRPTHRPLAVEPPADGRALLAAVHQMHRVGHPLLHAGRAHGPSVP